MIPENEEVYDIKTFREQRREYLLEKLEKFKKTYPDWTTRYTGSISKNGCLDGHNKPLEFICDHLYKEEGVVGVLAEKDAAEVLGVPIPDLLIIREEETECHEYQDRDTRIATFMKKMVRYGPAVDSLSIGLGLSSDSKEHVRTNWNAVRQITFNGGLKDVYREHLKVLGMTRVYPKLRNGRDKKHFRLEENTFYFDEDKDKVRAAFNPAELEDILDFKFYFVSENDIEVLRPNEV
jgi:hypothetical protein